MFHEILHVLCQPEIVNYKAHEPDDGDDVDLMVHLNSKAGGRPTKVKFI